MNKSAARDCARRNVVQVDAFHEDVRAGPVAEVYDLSRLQSEARPSTHADLGKYRLQVSTRACDGVQDACAYTCKYI